MRVRTNMDVVALLAVLAVGVTLLVPDSATVVRLPFALALLLILPGYALTAMILRSAMIGASERAALGLGLSISASILTALALAGLGIALTATTWCISLGAITVVASLVASALGHDRTVVRHPSAVHGSDVAVLSLAALLLAAAIVLGTTPLRAPDSVRGTTSLWALPNTERAVVVGIQSQQTSSKRYRLTLETTGGRPRTIARPTVRPGQRWTRRIPVSPGTQRMTFRLYEAGRPHLIYRRVTLRPSAQPPIRRR